MSQRRLAVLAALAAAALLWPSALPAQGTAEHLVRWQIVPGSPCPGDSVQLVVSWCTDCVKLIRAGFAAGGGLILEAERIAEDSCRTDACVTATRTIPLGAFQAGSHVLTGTLIEHLGGDVHVATPFQVSFFVRPDCAPVKYVDRVLLSGDGPRICADDSIHVTILGRLPSDCHGIRRVELYQPTYIRPGPPIVRVLVDDGGCLGRPCVLEPQPWRADLVLPPLPASDLWYSLAVEVYEVTCADTFPGRPVSTGYFPFQVFPPEACRLPACLIAKWSGPKSPACTATIAPDRPTSMILKIASGVPLAGLQGTLRFTDPGLRITALESVGAAATWSVSAHRLYNGDLSFVTFSGDGSLLPAVAPSVADTLGEPVLRVTVTAGAGDLAPVTRLRAFELLGADSAGGAVRGCVVIATVYFDLSARLCADRPCDANGDLVSDVRDLVTMVRCLYDTTCSDTARFDCDHDDRFTLGDALCCALAILRRHAEADPGAPRPDAAVGVTLGTPVAEDGVVSLPVRVRGVPSLGAALLQLRYPSSRYRLVDVVVDGEPAVFPLHHGEGDDLAVGFVNLIRTGILAVRVAEPDEVQFRVRLERLPGAAPEGALELVSGQFTGQSGERLAVDLPEAAMPIVPPARATISGARPNPFAREARFSVDLPQAASVEVTVHDLSGRRVAGLFRGELPAGRRDFTWTGTLERGGRAADGVYFVRLAADGRIVSRKVVLLRRP